MAMIFGVHGVLVEKVRCYQSQISDPPLSSILAARIQKVRIILGVRILHLARDLEGSGIRD